MLVEKTPTDVIRGSFYQAAFGREATRFVFVLRHPVLVGKKGRAGCRANDPATFFRGWLAAYDIMEADLEDLGKLTPARPPALPLAPPPPLPRCRPPPRQYAVRHRAPMACHPKATSTMRTSLTPAARMDLEPNVDHSCKTKLLITECAPILRPRLPRIEQRTIMCFSTSCSWSSQTWSSSS